MCLSSLPGLARVRHWSCPERLPSLSQDELLLPVRAKDAESLPRTPGLALWEDKVLSLRGSRGNKHRELLLERRLSQEEELEKDEGFELQLLKESEKEDIVITESLQDRLLRAFLGTESQDKSDYGDPQPQDSLELDEWCLGNSSTGRPLVDIIEEPSPQESPWRAPSSSPDNKTPPLEPGAASLSQSDEDLLQPLHDPSEPGGPSPWRQFLVSPSLPPKIKSDPLPLLCGPLSSYSFLTSLTSWLLLFLALWPPFIRRSRTGHGAGNQMLSRTRIRPRRPPWLLLATSCLLLHTTPILAQMDLMDLTGPEEPICADGVFRGNIDINNRDEDSKMSSLARYINCSVVEGSISITSALYSDEDTNYSIPNLTEVVSPGALLLSPKYSTFPLAAQLFSSIDTIP